ncbi:MAG: aldehyde dehydrogenase family protein, partial [Propionibacteriales bacterium]|nr:aldehyde dehydrogenase family protein [Propionibacteriales bacterium]
MRCEGSLRASIGSMDEKRIVDQVPKQLFIGGEWRDAGGGKTFAVEDPSTGDVIAHVADASVADGTAALDAAVAVQKEWAGSA